MKKLLIIAGSAREKSFSKAIAKNLYSRLQDDKFKNNEVDIEFIDLKHYPMPLYDGDYEDENGLPESARQLKDKFANSHGIIFVTPEYNSSLTPLLKNTIDWMSRAEAKDEPALIAFRGKIASLVGVSPGALGAMRVLVPMRLLLSNIGMTVLPDQVAIGQIMNVISDDLKNITDERTIGQLDNLLSKTLASL